MERILSERRDGVSRCTRATFNPAPVGPQLTNARWVNTLRSSLIEARFVEYTSHTASNLTNREPDWPFVFCLSP